MLRRTQISMRSGFRALSNALRPVAEYLSQERCGVVAAQVVVAALKEWDDPSAFAYEPGRLLEMAGHSVLSPVSKAIGALKSERDWAAFGQYFGEAMWISSGVPVSYPAR